MEQTLCKTAWQFIRKSNVEFPYDSAIPLLRYVPKRTANTKTHMRELPGGAVVKNLPANAGETGSIPGPGRSHMPRNQ